jgi:hypothetical protein
VLIELVKIRVTDGTATAGGPEQSCSNILILQCKSPFPAARLPPHLAAVAVY